MCGTMPHVKVYGQLLSQCVLFNRYKQKIPLMWFLYCGKPVINYFDLEYFPVFKYMSSEVRECLKLDQDHKRCFAHYKQVKKLNKLIESAEELIRDGR